MNTPFIWACWTASVSNVMQAHTYTGKLSVAMVVVWEEVEGDVCMYGVTYMYPMQPSLEDELKEKMATIQQLTSAR